MPRGNAGGRAYAGSISRLSARLFAWLTPALIGAAPGALGKASPARATPPASTAPLAVSESAESRNERGSAQDWQWTTVTYMTQNTVYLDSGSVQGLAVGVPVEVVHGDTIAATAVVIAVSSRRAACELQPSRPAIRAGDQVRYRPADAGTRGPDESGGHDAKTPIGATTRGPTRGSGDGRHGSPRLRGAIRLLAVRQTEGSRGTLLYPGVELRASEVPVPGSSFLFAADVRRRMSYHWLADEPLRARSRSEVHRLALEQRWDEGRTRLSLGRQAILAPSAVAALDGLAFERQGDAWSFGALSGVEPDPTTQRPDPALRTHGLWGRREWISGARRRGSISLALLGAYDQAEVRREFASMAVRLSRARGSIHLAQELDLIRRDLPGGLRGPLAPSATSVRADARVLEFLTLEGGVDHRRVPPPWWMTDSLREERGSRESRLARGGLRVRLGSRADLAADIRSSDSRSRAFRLRGRWRIPLRFDPSVRVRVSRLHTRYGEGWILNSGASFSVGVRGQAEIGFGGEAPPPLGVSGETDNRGRSWISLAAESPLGRRWFGLLSLEADVAGRSREVQCFTSLGYRR
jgi:hypothetical protein